MIQCVGQWDGVCMHMSQMATLSGICQSQCLLVSIILVAPSRYNHKRCLFVCHVAGTSEAFAQPHNVSYHECGIFFSLSLFRFYSELF